MHAAVPRHVLPVLVLAQFAGTSLWFTVNAVRAAVPATITNPRPSRANSARLRVS